MIRALDICALILLVICLWYIFWHKERKIEIGLCTEGVEATSRIVLRECNNGENTVTAIGEFTFPEGYVPNENLSSEILQQLNEVRKGGWGGSERVLELVWKYIRGCGSKESLEVH